MKLFTKQINNILFAQYKHGNDLSKQKVVAKIFNPYGRGVWYILNSDPNDPDYLWAIVDLIGVEIGSVSRTQLETMKVPPFKLPLERDIYFSPIPADEIYLGAIQGKRFEKGGEVEDENAEMLKNQTQQIIHHSKELSDAVKNTKEVEPWVITKTQRASTDLSDVTHYLEGENTKMAKGGIIKIWDKNDAYRLSPYNSIPSDVLDKVRGQLQNLKFAGNFGLKDWKQDGYLYFLDDFDRKLVANNEYISLKPEERVYRYLTYNTAIGGMIPLIKINQVNGLVYFPIYDNNDDFKFDRKGVYTQYLNLIKVDEEDYYASGGNISDEDLFENWESLPMEVQNLIQEYSEIDSISQAKEFISKLNLLGYDADYDMDGSVHSLRKLSGMMAKGGLVPLSDIPNVKEQVKKGIVTYRGTGMSGIGWKITVNGKEYNISDDDFRELKKHGNMRFSAPYRKAERGGMMAKGGKLSLSKFKEKYDKNEDENMHSENVLLLAQNFGDAQDVKDAKRIIAMHDSIGYLPMHLLQERDSLNIKLREKYKEAMASGKMAKGGVTFNEKVQSIKRSLLERKKVSPKVQKDYGKTYSPKEAEDSAKRIAGAMRLKEMK